jgi:hypothetical protein
MALRFRRRLFGLLAMAYTPYMVFMLTYWRTDEQRYWVILIPWIALFAAWAIWAGYDRLAAIGDRRWAPLGLILAGVAIVGIVNFSWPRIAKDVTVTRALWQPDLIAYEWLRENTAPDAAIMARNPWQLNWHSERQGLMIPNTADRAQLLTIAEHYGVDYLILENLTRVKGDAAVNLAPLIRPRSDAIGTVIEGFELVYASPTPDYRVFIYRLSQ